MKPGPKVRPPSDMFSEKRVANFWAGVDIKGEDDCWEWQRNIGWNGYGLLGMSQNKKVKSWRAHRYAWSIENGQIPEGLNVLHECDNRPCCNPKHLFVGTQKQNIHDSMDKDRFPKGETHGSSKLTEEQVRKIKFGMKSMNSATVVEMLGLDCHPTNIYNIREGKTWKHVKPIPINCLATWLEA